MKETINIFNTKTTEEVAQYLLGMYLEHETATGVLGGYIVDAEAYLGPDDEAAHSFGLRKTPRLQAMYDKPGTIYLYTMHTHLILNMVTQEQGKPLNGPNARFEVGACAAWLRATASFESPGSLFFLVRYGLCQKNENFRKKLRHYHELEFPIKVVGPSCL